jgi:hypothetical protein
LKSKSKPARSRKKKRNVEGRLLKKRLRSKKQDWLPNEPKLKLLKPVRGNYNANWKPSMMMILPTRMISKLHLKPQHRQSAARNSRGRKSHRPRRQFQPSFHRFLKRHKIPLSQLPALHLTLTPRTHSRSL